MLKFQNGPLCRRSSPCLVPSPEPETHTFAFTLSAHIFFFFLPCGRPLPAPAHYYSDSLHRRSHELGFSPSLPCVVVLIIYFGDSAISLSFFFLHSPLLPFSVSRLSPLRPRSNPTLIYCLPCPTSYNLVENYLCAFFFIICSYHLSALSHPHHSNLYHFPLSLSHPALCLPFS